MFSQNKNSVEAYKWQLEKKALVFNTESICFLSHIVYISNDNNKNKSRGNLELNLSN